MSASFDADDIHHTPGRAAIHSSPHGSNIHRQLQQANSHEEHPTPSTRDISYSQVSTPKMSQRDAFTLFINTPPHNGDHNNIGIISANNNNNNNSSITNNTDAGRNYAVRTPLDYSNNYGNTATPSQLILPSFPSHSSQSNDNNTSSLFITPFPIDDDVDSPNGNINASSITDNHKRGNPYYDPLEPPAWRPADPEETEYVETWNNSYNNQQYHFLQAGQSHYNHKGGNDDSSTICSSQTNNSLTNNTHNSATGATTGGMKGHKRSNSHTGHAALRPRGLSISSYRSDNASIPSQQQGHPQHRRHPSLPQSLFSSSRPLQHGHSQHRRHPSLPQSIFSSQQHQQQHQQHHSQNQPSIFPPFQSQYNKHAMNLLQSSKRNTPYEKYSHHNVSQVKADAAMAGLNGVLLELYVIDRCVDGATARMLATREEEEEEDNDDNDDSAHPLLNYQQPPQPPQSKSNAKQISTSSTKAHHRRNSSTSQKQQRKTSLGTLHDIQTILELHRVDKIVDRFKHGLQMPVFCEEEAWDSSIWRELRKVDLEMEGCSKRKKKKEEEEMEKEKNKHGTKEEEELEKNQKSTKKHGHGQKHGQRKHHHDRWGGRKEEDDWEIDEESEEDLGDDIYLSTDSFATDFDPYDFYDPHESTALQSHNYQPSNVSASISSDNLNEIIDLLRTDVEIDGASRRNAEMKMILPLYEMDKSMEKLRDRAEVRDLWCQGDVRALYLVDLEVDKAKRKGVSKPNKSREENVTLKPVGGLTNGNAKEENTDSPAEPVKPSARANLIFPVEATDESKLRKEDSDSVHDQPTDTITDDSVSLKPDVVTNDNAKEENAETPAEAMKPSDIAKLDFPEEVRDESELHHEKDSDCVHDQSTDSATDKHASDEGVQEKNQEMKTILSRHIPHVSQPLCPTSPALAPSQTPHTFLVSPKASQAPEFNHELMPPVLELSPFPPPSAPMSSPEPSKRSIFTPQEKANANMINNIVADSSTEVPHKAKRSIFSRKEKTSAAKQDPFQRGGVMMPGTTTVVRTQGGEMIDDIPVGKIVVTATDSAAKSP